MVTLNTRQKICILVFSEIAHDGRVLRQVEYARRNYDVDVIAHGEWEPPAGVSFFSLPRTTWKASISSLGLLLSGNLLARAWEKYFWQRPEYQKTVDILRAGRYDLIHANDLDTLPVAVTAAQGTDARVLFDAHEYSPDAGGETWLTRIRSPFRKYLLRKYGPQIDKMITVAEGISDLYRSRFAYDSQVIMNAPYYVECEFHAVSPSCIHLIHHGGAIPGRNIEDLILMMAKLDKRFQLHLMLLPINKGYFSKLRHLAGRVSADRIHFLSPVLPSSVTRTVNQFDIGIPLMKVEKISYFHALPNKFFDYIIAGLGIAVSPLPEMERIVRRHRIGVISPDQTIDSMVKTLNSLSTSQIDEFKKNSLLLAKTLNGDVEMEKLMDVYARLLST